MTSAIDFSGRGFATEALTALVPELFAQMPSSCDPDRPGFDFIEALTDTQNLASRKVLEKCGFICCEVIPQDFESPFFGLRDTVVYRIARPGKTLEGLGLTASDLTQSEDQGVTPPIQ